MNHCRTQQPSYVDLMRPDEDWRGLPDAAERRRIQNRLAQRAYRRNMRDRTKELEKLKQELASLKKDPVGRVSPRMSPQPQLAPATSAADDFSFDANTSADIAASEAWSESFAPTAQFADAPMNADSYFANVPEMVHPGSKRRRTSIGPDASCMPARTLSAASSAHGHQRSRSHTPMSSPPMVNASIMQNELATPPMAEFFISPCNNFDLGADMTDSMALPHMEESPAFNLDGFATNDYPVSSNDNNSNNNNNKANNTNTIGNGPNASLDHGLWTPPVTGSLYGSFLTPPTQHQDGGVSSPPTCWQSNGTPSTVNSEAMGRSRSYSSASSSSSSSNNNNISPYSAATSQFSSPALSATSKAIQPTGLNLNMAGNSTPAMDGSSATTPITNQSQSSLLHLAVSGGHISVLKLLLQSCEIPINVRDAKGYTALQRAVFAGKMDMVSMLIEHGADLSAGRQDDGLEAAAEQLGA